MRTHMNAEQLAASRLLDAVATGIGHFTDEQINRALWVLGDLTRS